MASKKNIFTEGLWLAGSIDSASDGPFCDRSLLPSVNMRDGESRLILILQTMNKMKKNKLTKGKAKPSEDKPRRKRGGVTLSPTQIEPVLTAAFAQEPDKVFNYKQLCFLFGPTTMAQKRQIVDVLEQMAVYGLIEEVELGRYRSNQKRAHRGTGEIEGIFSYRSGRANLIPDDGGEAIEIAEQGLGRALNGDRVRVSLRRRRATKSVVGKVIEVIERSPSTYVGIIQRSSSYAFFTSDNRELRQDIYIPEDKLSAAQHGDKVLVRVLGWQEEQKNPFGEVVDVLGRPGDNDTEMHAILAEYGLPYKYPEAVEEAAAKLSGEISTEELAQREDFREVFTCTIDPRDAKDFDDALSLRHLDEGQIEVGVHIADVSYFVRPDSVIDQEAYQRATSIYLVDRTIPMLPEHLSNGLCSLRPNEDKYTYSCIFTMDKEAKILSSRIVRAVICSDRRFTYEEVQETIETGVGDHANEVLELNRLARILRANRFAAGSIAFDRPEVRFEIDETGKPLSVYIKESKESHQLIEEFMLLANRTVAERIAIGMKKSAQAPTFVYRVHDKPDEGKLNDLSLFVHRFGYQLQTQGGMRQIAQSLNALLERSKGGVAETLISTVAIRAMAKAKYTTENIGHYGLAFDYYTHFTSPIRRYPDLMVHRLLTHYLVEGGRSADAHKYEEQCEHSSAMEQLAATAERASIRYKQVEYMSRFLGEEFDGVISGMAEWGIYVELEENKCEGMIPMRELDDDYYEYDEKNFAVVGRHTGRRFTLGDRVRISVAQASIERKLLDFSLVRTY